ncbi:MAG: hypothetical protein M3Y54_07385 [Bacteroidota bacterium]|nr:hypothetical protein [Bacteroidota bacterium]
MKNATRFLLFTGGICFISACSPTQENQDTTKFPSSTKEDRFESSNSSIAQSKKDGVFLTTCTVTPNSLAVSDSFSLDIKEAFIEQRFSLGARTNKVKLMDSLELNPKLIILFKKNAHLSRLWRDSFIELRAAPYTGGPSDDMVAFNLPKDHLDKKFALRLRVRNKSGQNEEYSLAVKPLPVKQALEENYNSSLAQAQQTGTLLATCAITPSLVTTDSFRLHIQEAFIEHRFLVGKHTHGVQLLDSVRVRPRLVIVAAPDSKLGPSSATWTLTLPGGGKLVGYQERAKVLAFDLPENDLRERFALQLRLKNQRGGYDTRRMYVEPSAVQQSSRLVAVPHSVTAPTEPMNNGLFEERSPVYNTSANKSRKAGMLLNAYIVTPTHIVVGDKFRLDIDQVFIEQHALITSVSKRIELDSTNLAGPRLVIVCKPTSTFGELGIDWDMQLQAGGGHLAYQVEQQKNLLLFDLPTSCAQSSFSIRLRGRNRQGIWIEQLLRITPQSPNSI